MMSDREKRIKKAEEIEKRIWRPYANYSPAPEWAGGGITIDLGVYYNNYWKFYYDYRKYTVG
jgi:hypothetical protein